MCIRDRTPLAAVAGQRTRPEPLEPPEGRPMPTPDRLTKTQRRDEARAAALKLREEQQRTAKRRRTIAIAVGVGGVVVLAVLIWTILAQGNRSTLADVALRPAGSTLSGGCLLYTSDAADDLTR